MLNVTKSNIELNKMKSKSLKRQKIQKEIIMARTKHDTFTMLEYEHKYLDMGKKYIAGVDEVGRGPLAGPVVVASVIMPLAEEDIIQGVNDSKKVSEKNREILYQKIISKAIACSIEWADEKVIDEINILNATKEAMKEAVKNLNITPEHLLIDAVKLDIKIPSTSIIKGDALSASIAAASIIAKVTRDRMMIELGEMYPEYGYEHHKGYGTKAHIEAVKKYGVKDFYRFTFAPISDLIKDSEVEEVVNK